MLQHFRRSGGTVDHPLRGQEVCKSFSTTGTIAQCTVYLVLIDYLWFDQWRRFADTHVSLWRARGCVRGAFSSEARSHGDSYSSRHVYSLHEEFNWGLTHQKHTWVSESDSYVILHRVTCHRPFLRTGKLWVYWMTLTVSTFVSNLTNIA